MPLSIEMRRSILVRSLRFSGTVSMTEKREEIVAVLKAITELGGAVQPTDLVGYLIPEGLEAAAERLLVIATVHGLVRHAGGRFELTEQGQKARDVEHVLVPRDGAWQVWLTSDPLIHFNLLHVEAVRPGEALSELRETGGRRSPDASPLRTMPVPAILRALHSVEGRLLAKEGRVVRVDDLGKEVAEESSDAQVDLLWTLRSDDTSRLSVRGVVQVRRGDGVERLPIDADVPPPGVTFTDVFNQLLDNAEVTARWDPEAAVLRCPFDDQLTPAAIQSMHRTVTARKLDLSAFGLGAFEKVAVPDVPITASDATGAGRWSARRLLMGIQDHQTTSRYEAVLTEAARPFAEFSVELPSRAALLQQMRSKLDLNAPRPEIYWRLQAPADWSL